MKYKYLNRSRLESATITKSQLRSRLITNCALSASIQANRILRQKYNNQYDIASKRDAVLTRQQRATHALDFKRVV